jgi:tetratricopeptide (TPR) repeat protein
VKDNSSIQVSGAVAEAARERIAPPRRRARLASVRVSPGGYLAVGSLLTFAALLLLRVEQDMLSLIALILAWFITPLLAFTDYISFDGHSLSRKGLVALFLRLIARQSHDLKLEEIERVETDAVRTLRRGGRVRYRYRSEVIGQGMSFVFASGGGSYRRMVQTLFRLIPDEKLDARSGELRDYLTDPASLRITLGQLKLAPSSVLEGATGDLLPSRKGRIKHQRIASADGETSAVDIERGLLLRRAANELRAAGRLRESAEAFRRSLLVLPRDAALIYEFARFLRSQASALSDARLLARSRAGLRLSAQRAAEDATLLARIGESFFEFGEMDYATRLFRRALEVNPHAYRAQVGLAEVALRDGKLAHVIHHYGDSARIASDAALARFAQREADYYARLNDDDEYLAAELRRMNWLQHLYRARRLASRLTIGSVLLSLIGPFIDDSVAAAGWALASTSIIAWTIIALAIRALGQRR